jgi:hypothetical protein
MRNKTNKIGKIARKAFGIHVHFKSESALEFLFEIQYITDETNVVNNRIKATFLSDSIEGYVTGRGGP